MRPRAATRAASRSLRPVAIAAVGALLMLPLAACGNEDGNASASAACEKGFNEDITLLVPYSPGGGFDTWARLMAPKLEKYLDGDGQVVVENQDGGGGMRAVYETNAAEADGSTIIFTEPGYITVNQVLGRTESDFDVRDLTYLGQVTADPQVFAVSGDSDVNTIEDLANASPIKHAAQDISPIETITYATYGVDADFVLHDGTSEAVLSVRRGDTDATVISLSSILEFLKSGDLKPILYLGTEEITPDLIGYEELKGVETAESTGHPELNEVLEQHRVLAAPPNLPDCVKDAYGKALADTLADKDFQAEAEKAELRIVPTDAEDAEAMVDKTAETFEKYEDTLSKALAG
jgi:tripartite-type tricarboxylate transporter receptor subunit TctC